MGLPIAEGRSSRNFEPLLLYLIRSWFLVIIVFCVCFCCCGFALWESKRMKDDNSHLTSDDITSDGIREMPKFLDADTQTQASVLTTNNGVLGSVSPRNDIMQGENNDDHVNFKGQSTESKRVSDSPAEEICLHTDSVVVYHHQRQFN